MGSETTRDEVREALARMRVTGALARRDARFPHPDYDKESVETAEFSWGDIRVLLPRARPLPADVQAVVERVSDALTIVHPIEDLARLHYDSPTHPTENVALYAPIAMEYVSVGDLRTLLAHLQRQDTP